MTKASQALTLELENQQLDEMLRIDIADAGITSLEVAAIEFQAEGDFHVLERSVLAAKRVISQCANERSTRNELTRRREHYRCR